MYSFYRNKYFKIILIFAHMYYLFKDLSSNWLTRLMDSKGQVPRGSPVSGYHCRIASCLRQPTPYDDLSSHNLVTSNFHLLFYRGLLTYTRYEY